MKKSNKDNKASKKLDKALKELVYMEKHLDKYKSFHSVEDLMKDLNN
jgi:hypothetical protein